MKMNEVRELTDAELAHMYEELRQEGLNLQVQAKTGQLQNSARVNSLRKDVARLKTEMNVRSRGQKETTQAS